MVEDGALAIGGSVNTKTTCGGASTMRITHFVLLCAAQTRVYFKGAFTKISFLSAVKEKASQKGFFSNSD